MNIRNKLILMLAIPLAALLIVALWGFQAQSAQAEQNEDAASIASSVLSLQELTGDIAEERLALVRVRLAQSDPALQSSAPARLNELEEAIAATDIELAEIADARDPFVVPVGESVDGILGDSREADLSDTSLAKYSAALSNVNAAIEGTPLPGFSADSVLAVQAIQQAREVVDSQESVWIEFFTLAALKEAEAEPVDLTSQQVADFMGAFGHVDFVSDAASKIVYSNGQTPMLAPTISGAARGLGEFQALGKEDLLQNTIGDLNTADVVPLLLSNRAQWNLAVQDASNFLLQNIQTENDTITDSRSLFTLLAVLGTLLLITLIYVIGRSILGPLGRLMEHAEVMTQERLPFAVAKLRSLGASDEMPELRAIPKEANDEIGSLVDAFNDVQETAVKVATDQARSRRNVAEMFVSLGRRNQQLNHRMINLISDLEQDEQDSETLAGLYQLDHLATRMRRNAESLLVLAGNRSPRQWSRPVPVEDVLRSSITEVELYERIDVGDLPELAMQGNVVTDVTHLLAELLDNATQFSEPSTRVSLSAQETLEGVEIEIFDEGFGVNEHDLADLNERITNPPALDEAPSRLLGLFVVGRLAQQHNIDVELQSQPGVGTVATVFVPSALFAEVVAEPGDRIEAPAGYVAQETVAQESVPEPLVGSGEDQSDFLAGLEALVVDPAIDVPAIDVPAIEAPAMEAPLTEALATDAPVVEAWEPEAVHEEILADASVPTMEEVEEALPSFPGVTIDEPGPMTPATPSADDDNWPLSRLDAAEIHQPSTSISQLDAMAPAVGTPAFETPIAPEAPATSMAAPVVQVAPAHEATPAPDMAPVEPFSIAPPVPETDPAPVSARSLPAPPIVEAAPAHEAPAPVAESLETPSLVNPVVPAPVAEAPAPIAPAPPLPEAPAPEPTFGGLPTRAPMATLESAQVKPALMPLENAGQPAAAEETPKAAASAFAAFATGVNRGLNKVKDEPKPQFQDEGENT